eukprot:3057953-Pyramimonas_sp.AAC.1
MMLVAVMATTMMLMVAMVTRSVEAHRDPLGTTILQALEEQAPALAAAPGCPGRPLVGSKKAWEPKRAFFSWMLLFRPNIYT